MRVSGIVLNGGMGSGKDTVGAYIGNAYGYGRVALAEPLYALADHVRHRLLGRHGDYHRTRMLLLLEDLLGSSRNAAGEPLPPADIDGVEAALLSLGGRSDLLDESLGKPRGFLQGAGDLVRQARADALPDMLMRTVVSRTADAWLDSDEFRFVVTDARSPREMDCLRRAAGYARRMLGGEVDFRLVVVRLNVSADTIVARISSRDGTPEADILEALRHPNEAELRGLPDSYFDRVIDADRGLDAVYDEADAMVRELGMGRRA